MDKIDQWLTAEPDADEEDDPVCVCGTHRSEHALCGCAEGFQTADDWKAERSFIESLSDDEFERIYGIPSRWRG